MTDSPLPGVADAGPPANKPASPSLNVFFDVDMLHRHTGPQGPDEQDLVLTPNKRLALQIAAACEQDYIGRSEAYWATPAIYSIDDWISTLWRQQVLRANPAILGQRILDTNQETLLWEQIIQEDSRTQLLNLHATAKMAQAAWRSLQLWQLDISPEFFAFADSAMFAAWTRRFMQHCQRRQYQTAAGAAGLLLQQLREKPDCSGQPGVQRIILVGFQHIPPLHQALVRLIGNEVRSAEPQRSPRHQAKSACSDIEQELTSAARWAHRQWADNGANRIGIIVPELNHRRALCERLFAQQFAPGSWLPDAAADNSPFNISAAESLGEQPMIYSALTLLGLNLQQIELPDLLHLLHSPFLAPVINTVNAASLEQKVRATGMPHFTLEQLTAFIGQTEPDEPTPAVSQAQPNTDGLLSALEHFATLRAGNRQKRAPLQHWLALFQQQLAVFNWPGERARNSAEYQQISGWDKSIDRFCRLQAICGEVNLERALSLLTRHIKGTDHQPESGAAPIQILGMLEGGGLDFDKLWIVGVNDNSWPPHPAPTPFIPSAIQRDQAMPHASAERELAFCRRLLQDYRRSTDELVVSYSLREGDEPLRPSVLIEDFSEINQTQAQEETRTAGYPWYPVPLPYGEMEYFEDHSGPALEASALQVKGGVQVIRDQAACPFRAFARHRLQASPLDEPGWHPNARLRGIVLHSALEHIWQRLGNFETLQNSNNDSLKPILEKASDIALSKLAKQRPDLCTPAYISLEKQRLCSLFSKWLLLEAQRRPFQVAATEKNLVADLGPLSLRMRIDRIDQLADGGLLLIDYKTGTNSVRYWQGERPDEPQLPIYAISIDRSPEQTGGDRPHPVRGISFAQLNVDKQGFIGIAAENDYAPGIHTPDRSRSWQDAPTWPEVQADWQTHLLQLADQFKRGEARVDPKNGQTCHWCNLQALCRIHEKEGS